MFWTVLTAAPRSWAFATRSLETALLVYGEGWVAQTVAKAATGKRFWAVLLGLVIVSGFGDAAIAAENVGVTSSSPNVFASQVAYSLDRLPKSSVADGNDDDSPDRRTVEVAALPNAPKAPLVRAASTSDSTRAIDAIDGAHQATPTSPLELAALAMVLVLSAFVLRTRTY